MISYLYLLYLAALFLRWYTGLPGLLNFYLVGVIIALFIKSKSGFWSLALVVITFLIGSSLFDQKDAIKLSLFCLLGLACRNGNPFTFDDKTALKAGLLLLVPIGEIIFRSNNFGFGFARSTDTTDLIFTNNTVELPLLTLLFCLFLTKKSERIMVILGVLVLLLNVYSFNRRFVVIIVAFHIFVKFYQRPAILFVKSYAILIPLLWSKSVEILEFLLTRTDKFSDFTTKGRGTDNTLGASGRLDGWLGCFDYFIEERPWVTPIADLPSAWISADSEKYYHVHNTIMQVGLDFGLLAAISCVIVVLLIRVKTSYTLTFIALMATESLLMNFTLISLITIYVFTINDEKVKDIRSHHPVKF